jgi:uncharacterized integral membrane protein
MTGTLSRRNLAQGIMIGSGLLFFVANLSICIGYASGDIPHKPFKPEDALLGLMCVSLVLAVLSVGFYCAALRRLVSGWTIVFIVALMLVSAAVDLKCAMEAIAAV